MEIPSSQPGMDRPAAKKATEDFEDRRAEAIPTPSAKQR